MKQKIIPSIIIMFGFALLSYPFISNYIFEKSAGSTIKSYEKQVKTYDQKQKEKAFEEAKEYNEDLAKSAVQLTDPFKVTKSNGETFIYNNILNIDHTGIMGYLEIPCISVNFPVYHGTDAKVLERGIGHMPDTSLPVGGESCHAVLSGHRGLANAKIFTDLNKMEVGDVFYIKVLHHTFAYQVDQILTVLPSDTDSLQIEKGKDYVTLVTCTPYAVNTHRLLVRGTRIPYEEAQKIDEEVGLQCTIPFNLILLIAGIVAFIIIWVSIKLHKRRKEKKHEQNK